MKENNLSVTVDIEDWYHIPSVCGSPFSTYGVVDDFFKDWGEKSYDYLTEPTERVLNLLDEFRIVATFFIVADVCEHYPGLVEKIVERGHEIGCHGLHHSCKIHPKTKDALMSRSEFEERTLEARRSLERICRGRVAGYRAPNALVGGWMLDSLEKIGFKYDSSVCVNSLYNKTDSELKGVESFPYYPQRNGLERGEGDRDFVEFPWAYYDMGVKIPSSGGPILRFFGAGIVLNGLKQSLKRGHTLLYFHPLDISRLKFPDIGRCRPLYWSIKGDVVERRIRHLLNHFKDAKKMSLGEVAGVRI